MANSWESQVWRETLAHEGSHPSALPAYKFGKPKRDPHVPSAATQNGRESATDTWFMPGRDRASEYTISALSGQNAKLFKASQRRVQRERKHRRSSTGGAAVPAVDAHWPVEALLVHGGADETRTRLADPHERKRVLVAPAGEFQMVHDDGGRHRATPVPVGLNQYTVPRAGDARAQTAGRAHNRAQPVFKHELGRQSLLVSQVLASSETKSLARLSYSGKTGSPGAPDVQWSKHANDLLKEAVATCGDGGGTFARDSWRNVAEWVNDRAARAGEQTSYTPLQCRRRWFNWDKLDGHAVDPTHDPAARRGPSATQDGAWIAAYVGSAATAASAAELRAATAAGAVDGRRSGVGRRDLDTALCAPAGPAYDALDRVIRPAAAMPPRGRTPLHWSVRCESSGGTQIY